MKKRASELEWLKWYYENIQPVLGSADGDVNDGMQKEFERETGKVVPKGYRYGEE